MSQDLKVHTQPSLSVQYSASQYSAGPTMSGTSLKLIPLLSRSCTLLTRRWVHSPVSRFLDT